MLESVEASGATISRDLRIDESPSFDNEYFATEYHMVQDVRAQESFFGKAEASVSELEVAAYFQQQETHKNLLSW